MLLQASCLDSLTCIDGDGRIKTERRRLTGFSQIENFTEFDVVYKKADTTGVAVTADGNLLDNIVTSLSGQVLEIRTQPDNSCFDYSRRPVIEVSSPGLNSVYVSGSGNFTADFIEGNVVNVTLSGSGQIGTEHVICGDLEVSLSGSGRISFDDTECTNSDAYISGSGNILLTGECKKSTMKISGSGNMHADKFITETAAVTISGSGDAFTYIMEKLTGAISGSGNIYVKGNPIIDVSVSGSGRVIRN